MTDTSENDLPPNLKALVKKPSAASQLLGTELIGYDQAAGWVDLAFHPTEALTNKWGAEPATHRGLHLAARSQAQPLWVIEAKLGAALRSMQIVQLALQHLQTQAASTAMPRGCLKIAHLRAHLPPL
jgi:hypothetical protein